MERVNNAHRYIIIKCTLYYTHLKELWLSSSFRQLDGRFCVLKVIYLLLFYFKKREQTRAIILNPIRANKVGYVLTQSDWLFFSTSYNKYVHIRFLNLYNFNRVKYTLLKNVTFHSCIIFSLNDFVTIKMQIKSQYLKSV